MSKKHGYVYEREISRGFYKRKDCYFLRIPDTRFLSIMSKSIIAPKVPSDFFMLWKGISVFIEAKSTKNPTSFAFRNIKPHQLQASKIIENHGGCYVFLICKRDKRNKFITYRVYGYEMRRLLADAINDEKRTGKKPKFMKSVKWEVFEKKFPKFERIRGVKEFEWKIGPTDIVTDMKNDRNKYEDAMNMEV